MCVGQGGRIQVIDLGRMLRAAGQPSMACPLNLYTRYLGPMPMPVQFWQLRVSVAGSKEDGPAC